MIWNDNSYQDYNEMSNDIKLDSKWIEVNFEEGKETIDRETIDYEDESK